MTYYCCSDVKRNQMSFSKHFTDEITEYGDLNVVSLVDHNGLEKVMADAFLQHIQLYNCENMKYVAFNFHEYCRRQRFMNVDILIDELKPDIEKSAFTWTDMRSVLNHQNTVFRTNCMDCLDRTNLSQSQIAHVVIETQLMKLGIIQPDEDGQIIIDKQFEDSFNKIWADNGDAISRQYSGTAALKGSYTRYRKSTVIDRINDLKKSGDRYKNQIIRDKFRQWAIDISLGINISTSTLHPKLTPEQEAANQSAIVSDTCQIILDKHKEENELYLGSWALIDSSTSCCNSFDTILILTTISCYVTRFDEDKEEIMSCQKIKLEDVKLIEIGKVKTRLSSGPLCLRFHYEHGVEGNEYFYTWRPTNLRLFNNMLMSVNSDNDRREILQIIAETFKMAKDRNVENLTITDNQILNSSPASGSNVCHNSSEDVMYCVKNDDSYLVIDDAPQIENLDSCGIVLSYISMEDQNLLRVPQTTSTVSKSSSDTSLVNKASTKMSKMATYYRELKAKRSQSPRQRLDDIAVERIRQSKITYADSKCVITIF